jgi:prepilin-type N-terminal cleavage/methylation domain-containing protein
MTTTHLRHDDQSGFSLIEVMVATGVLTAGLLSLAGMFAVGMLHVRSSSPSLVAREKAREAVESVHTARDMRIITWNEIRNKSQGGKFLNGEVDMKAPGDDGLVNTDDDTGLEEQMTPGLDNVLGTSDDEHMPLRDYKREIQITDLPDPIAGGNYDDLRQLRVIIRYKVGGAWRTYTLSTYISSYS